MGETLERILEKLKDGEINIATAERMIEKMFEDRGLRDGFAMAAAPLMLERHYIADGARMCYQFADEMMKARE